MSMPRMFLIILVSFMEVMVTVNGEEGNALSHSPTTVLMINEIKVKVMMRCQSIQKDLGFMTLSPGQSKHWKVLINATGDTPTYCHFECSVGTASFEIFNPTRDWVRCPLFCNWAIKSDGVHGFKQSGVEDNFFPWPTHRL